MVGPPPPPPPGPPPPPMGAPPPMVDPKGRDLLLQSIRSGAKLKKTVTNDKSAPLIAGKTTNGSGSNDSEVRPGRPPILSGSATIARSNGLAGLFADGMPKLKPTGLSIGKQAQSSSLSSLPTANSSSLHSSNSVKSEIGRRPIDSRTRGPPPQPPPTAQKPSLHTSVSDTTLTNNTPGTHTRSQSTVSLQNGRVGRGGKPILMPKPQAPAPPPPGAVKRSGVSRAHSMRAPASPPIIPQQCPAGPVFPNSELSGRAPVFHASTDSLIRMGPRHRPPLRAPATRPPPPPKQALPLPPPPPGQPPPAPPPPPPHRTAPPLPTSQPPPPPVRGSSRRNGGATDFESRFFSSFHKVNDFPPPPAFTNVSKIYNSKTAKPQAPAPPKPTIQLGSAKMWSHNTSSC